MYYLTKDNFPVKLKGQKPPSDWIRISESGYCKIRDERNAEIEAERVRQEEEMRPIREQNKRIQEKLEEMVLLELNEEKL
jgi:hypothetical protein